MQSIIVIITVKIGSYITYAYYIIYKEWSVHLLYHVPFELYQLNILFVIFLTNNLWNSNIITIIIKL